jgi:hypothetical protein
MLWMPLDKISSYVSVATGVADALVEGAAAVLRARAPAAAMAPAAAAAAAATTDGAARRVVVGAWGYTMGGGRIVGTGTGDRKKNKN